MINFIDLQRQRELLEPSLSLSIKQVLDDGNFILGKPVNDLENRLSSIVGSNCVTVANGTDALLISLMAIGIKEGDEVLLPSFTWISTAEVVCLLKAKPVFVDIDNNFLISLEKIEEKISSKTKAIIPVSMFGRCPDLEAIQIIAKKYDIYSIEDAAQSFGAKCNGIKSCSHLDISTTSFFPSKPLGCYGDGGAIFSNNEELLKHLKAIPRHGQIGRYNYVELGLNSRLDTLQAAILLEKLTVFDNEIILRNSIASHYHECLKDNLKITLPSIPKGNNQSVWAQFTILLDRDLTKHRSLIMEKLNAAGIPSALYYPVPLHTVDIFREFNCNDLSNTNEISERVLSLPMHPYLSKEEIEIISENLNNIVSSL